MHCYVQSTGCWYDRDGRLRGKGYAGAPAGKNNPLMQAVPSVGPIPQGKWRIIGPPFQHPHAGPFTLRLHPFPETNTFTRVPDSFMIHGDTTPPGFASEGCIVLDRPVREWIWSAVLAGDADLLVVADDAARPASCA